MSEQEFINSFNARFPYRDREAATALILQGWALSSNAAFCVLHEICRPPLSAEVDAQTLRFLVSRWSEAGDHPLKRLLLSCATMLIDDIPMPCENAVSAMDEIGEFDGQFAALAIAYFAGDCSTDHRDEALENAYKAIRGRWDTQ